MWSWSTMSTRLTCDRCELPGLMVSVVIGLGFGGWAVHEPAGLPEGIDEKGGDVIDTIVEQARPAVQLSLSGIEQEQDRTDRRLLWLGRDEIVGLAVWFNPIGPTILTIEVCSLPDGSRYLVYFQRHPSAPRYRVVAELEPDQESTQIASAITELVDEGSAAQCPRAVEQTGRDGERSSTATSRKSSLRSRRRTARI